MRFATILLAFLLLATNAQAMPPYGAGSGIVACQPPTTDGVQYAAPSTCTVTANSFNWTFGAIVGTGPNYHLLASGTGAFEFGDIIGRSGGNLFWRTTGSCGSLWSAFPTLGFVGGFAGSPLNEFTDATPGHRRVSFNNLSGAISAAGVNGVVSIQPIPSLYGTCWPQGENDFKSGQTINLAAGVVYAAGFDIGGNSTNAIGVSIIGDSGTPAIFETEMRVRDGSTSPLFEYITVQSLNGAACGPGPGSGILTGNDGVVTLLHVRVNGCGSGQDHNVYISQGAGANDPTGSAQITDLISTNVVGGGWTLKMRPAGINTQNHVTQSTIGCTLNGNNLCEVNGAVDMPCGGDYKIDFSTIERGQCSNVSNCAGYIFRALEELRNGTSQCPVAYAATNRAIIDHNIIIWDGASPGWPVTNVLCAGTHDGSGNCETGGLPGTGYTYALTNNVIVSDSANSIVLGAGAGVGSGAGCTMVAGKCTDANNNRWYNNRTTAAANESWSGSDQFGNPCCAFPWLPAHP